MRTLSFLSLVNIHSLISSLKVVKALKIPNSHTLCCRPESSKEDGPKTPVQVSGSNAKERVGFEKKTKQKNSLEILISFSKTSRK